MTAPYAPDQLISSAALTYHDYRAKVLRDTFEACATCLLRDRRPADNDLSLLMMVIIEAGLAGDRDVLRVGSTAVARLERYLPPETRWSDEISGRLWALRLLVGASEFFLARERDGRQRVR